MAVSGWEDDGDLEVFERKLELDGEGDRMEML